MTTSIATMPPLHSFVSEFTPGAAFLAYIAAIITFHYLKEWRETRKLSMEDRQARREGFMALVESLQDENRDLRVNLLTNEKTHDEYRRMCQQETDQLRGHVVHLEDRVAGLMRKIADIAIRAARGDIDAEMAASILQLANEGKDK